MSGYAGILVNQVSLWEKTETWTGQSEVRKTAMLGYRDSRLQCLHVSVCERVCIGACANVGACLSPWLCPKQGQAAWHTSSPRREPRLLGEIATSKTGTGDIKVGPKPHVPESTKRIRNTAMA